MSKTYKDKFKGVRIPLPKQRGGVHTPKTDYKRKPRSKRRLEAEEGYYEAEFAESETEDPVYFDYKGNDSERL